MRNALALVALTTACGQARTEPQDSRHPSAVAERSASCPLGIQGAAVEVADTAPGVDLTITGAPERVDELRQRARDAAALHGAGAHLGQGHDGQHLGHQRHGLRLTSLPPVAASVEDVEGGARIHLAALVPAQLDALREQAREHVAAVMSAPCD